MAGQRENLREEGNIFGGMTKDVFSLAYSLMLNYLLTWPLHEPTGLTGDFFPVCGLRVLHLGIRL